MSDVSDTSDTSTIGRAIRAARREAGLSQTQLAELVGLSDRTLRDIEKGSRSPSIGAVAAVAGALGLHLRADR
ncbi:helix-turn-helix transcriptional regulator [Citricoccus sp. GCM10030269]|uniref:helix-turn-helix transcriptional regulator n=1 Tax=Citricoccus sp. GCM10030269 TaxID=3273388 RepID=UPI00361BE27F